MHKIWHYLKRERLIWFVAAGFSIFVLDAYYQKAENYRITIDLPLVQRIAAQWQASTRRTPSATEINGLIEAHIREEILMREALIRNLDNDDVILRRRLAQKMEFLLADRIRVSPPDADVLARYYDVHRARFARPPRFSFRHIFLGSDVAAVNDILMQLDEGANWRNLGQAFILQREYSARAVDALARDFGSDFVQALTEYVKTNDTVGDWFGPIRSAYGVHIVQLVRFTPEQILPLADTRDEVMKTWQAEAQTQANEAAWAELRARYQVEFAPLSPPLAEDAGR